MSIDPIDTQQLVPWNVPAVYGRSVAGNIQSFDITLAQYDRGTKEGGNSYGAYVLRNERFTMALDVIPFDPQVGDIITRPTYDNLTRYVTSVERSDFLKFFILDTSAPDINGSFSTTVNIKRPTPTRAAWGGRIVSTFTTIQNEIEVALQPEQRSMTQANSRHVTQFDFVVYLPNNVYLLEGDILEDVDSTTIYEVMMQSDIDRLGIFSMAKVQRKI